MKQPVFILGSHKSGTTLLRNLINGAPDLFVVPLEAHFFQLTGFWVNYALRRSYPQTVTFEQVKESLIRHIRRSNEIASRTSDSVLVGQWNVAAVETYLIKHARLPFESHDWRGFFDAYIEALHVGLDGKPPETSRFLEKSVENAEYATLLTALYPDAKFIHIVRNPYATLVSLRRHMSLAGYPLLTAALSSLNNSYYYLYKNPHLLSDYLVVRYEELLENPEDIMRRIADHIGIPFSPQLLIPTTQDEIWSGNSSSGEAFDGISNRPISAWQEHIHPLESAFVNLLFPHVLRDFGYERWPVTGSLYRRASQESVKTYIKNRWLWQLVSRSGVLPL